MEGALRVQDIIGLILAILIVAILISIILILRESARERRMWKDDYDDYEDERRPKKKLAPPRKPLAPRARIKQPQADDDDQGPSSELEAKRKWSRIPRERVSPKKERERPEEEEVVVERVPRPKTPSRPPVPPVKEPVPPEVPEDVYEAEPEERKERIKKVPLEDRRVSREPRQTTLERALKKLAETGLDIKGMKAPLGEENIELSPLLWEARDEVKSGKAIGDIVIHTAFKSLPGHSGEEVVELYRSGDVSMVEKLEARVRTGEGRDYVVAVLPLSHFRPPDLVRVARKGVISEEEFELLNAMKFVDRTTKKDFARVVYSLITSE